MFAPSLTTGTLCAVWAQLTGPTEHPSQSTLGTSSLSEHTLRRPLLSENVQRDSCCKTNAPHLGLALPWAVTMLPDVIGQSERLSFLGQPGFQFRGYEV